MTDATPLDQASELDRLYFEQHPDENVYIRARFPGEWGPYEDEISGAHTQVTQIEPGVRVRRALEIVWETSLS